MIHQLTAFILSCLMLVVSATSQLGLQFCLCEKTMFMGDCPCDELMVADESFACSCCESCGESTPETPLPCDDCNIPIELALDVCIPHVESGFKVCGEHDLLSPPDFITSESYHLFRNEVMLFVMSASPPPDLLSESTPLYIRHSVFLI